MMLELTINEVVYQFNFGMGFMREINKKVSKTVEGMKKDVGLQYAVAGLIDGDVEELVNILDIANKGNDPRVTRTLLDSFIDNEDTDIDAVFAEVLDFFKRSNATKKTTMAVLELVEKEQEKMAAQANQ